MKRSFFQALTLVAASGFVLPLFAQPARSDGSVILRSAPSFDQCARTGTVPLYDGGVAGKPVSYVITQASDVNEARIRDVAQLSDQSVFEGGRDFSQQRSYEASTGGFPLRPFNPCSVEDRYSPFAWVGGIARVLDAPMVAPDGERLHARNAYLPLLNLEVLRPENTPRTTDFATFAAQGARPASFLLNYPNVIPIIRL